MKGWARKILRKSEAIFLQELLTKKSAMLEPALLNSLINKQ